MHQSNLGNYLKQAGGQSVDTSSTCKSLESSADIIKSSDTVDVWADVNSRLLYKVRLSDTTNPAQNFVDVGLNYKGGNSYPFFITGQTKINTTSATYSVTATLDSKTNAVSATVNASETGGSPFSLSGNFSILPSNDKLTISTPPNAKPIANVLNSLGLGQYITQLQNLTPTVKTTAYPLLGSPFPPLTPS